MKIGFDVSQTAEEKAGCGFMADQLIRSLVAFDKRNEYLLYPTFYSYRHPEFRKATKPDATNCRFHFEGMSFQEMVDGWEMKMGDRSNWLGAPDIIHSNNFSCVKDHSARIVFTLYDVAPIAFPEFTTEANRLVCFDGLFSASLYADHCVAISEYTKRSFLSYFPHYPAERITVVPLGTRPTIKTVKEPEEIKKRLKKFDLTGEFWLGIGTLEPRKNYRLLIDAYEALNDQRPLVIAGGKGWLESDLGRKVQELGLEKRIRFIGYVSEEELSALYSSCFAFVYPSHFEGFGLPVLEAMSCGAAVITSNTSSLPEVGGDAVLYIDPKSKESLISKMKLLIQNEAVIKGLRIKAVERAQNFSWDEAARVVLDVYDSVTKNGPWMNVPKNLPNHPFI